MKQKIILVVVLLLIVGVISFIESGKIDTSSGAIGNQDIMRDGALLNETDEERITRKSEPFCSLVFDMARVIDKWHAKACLFYGK